MKKITKNGYSIVKSSLSKKELLDLKKELTVTPHVNQEYGDVPHSFEVFRQNKEKIYLPRFFGLKKYGKPEEIKFNDYPKKENLEFPFSLRDNQKIPVDACLKSLNDSGGAILCVKCGGGKCLGKNTPVLMYNGGIKKVQDVIVGDALMGDDSTPRIVSSVCSGKEKMYRVKQSKGDDYRVNESHILSLFNILTEEVEDISVKDYLSNLDKQKILHGYKVNVNYNDKDINIRAYILGYWLGLEEIDERIYDKSFGNFLDKNNLLYEKYIPDEYKYNTRKKRFDLLTGIIDSAARKNELNESIVLNISNRKMHEDTKFLLYSLGLDFKINGIEIVIEKFNNLSEKKYIDYEIKLEEEDIDDYYGFEIDCNRRFLLGDTTVTHNTVMSLYVASVYKVKTLVIVHKTFLLNQWKERIEEFLPKARIGVIRQKKVDIEDKDIVIGMLQSLSMKDYDKNLFANNFGMVIYDEVHHASSEVFSRALPLVSTKYMIGLTATPNRKDGLTKVFKWYLGDIAYTSGSGENKGVVVKRINFSCENSYYCQEYTNFKGQLMIPKMITQISGYRSRNNIILNEIKQYITDDGRQILVLSDRRSHLNFLKNETDKMCIKRNQKLITTGFYVGGGASKKKEIELKESESKDVVFGTYAMAKEGLDIPSLNTLILGSPVGDVEQAVGRILRKQQDVYPIVIDLVDRFSIFNSQGMKRRHFYSKNKYYIKEIFIDDKDDFEEKSKKLDKTILYDDIEKFSKLDVSIVKKEKNKAKTIQEYMFMSDDSDDEK